MKNELLSIGEAAKLKQVSVKSLRYYETIGILKPAYVDPSSGYRYYSPNQMIDLDVILTCIELGIPLKSLADHKTNRGSLNLKELLISGRDTALANVRRAEDSLMRINSCIDEIAEQEILRHKDAPYARCLNKRNIFISPWNEKEFSVKSYTKAMAELYRAAEESGATPLYFQGFTVASCSSGLKINAYVEVGRMAHSAPRKPFTQTTLPKCENLGFRIEGRSITECMNKAFSHIENNCGLYSITEVWDSELPENIYVVEVLREVNKEKITKSR